MNKCLPLKLVVNTSSEIPSFKNRKRSGVNRTTGKLMLYTEPKSKQRMAELESAIESALYSSSPTTGGETDSEWLKQLRTALFGLSDDSLAEIPEFSFGVRRAAKPGVEIMITKETP